MFACPPRPPPPHKNQFLQSCSNLQMFQFVSMQLGNWHGNLRKHLPLVLDKDSIKKCQGIDPGNSRNNFHDFQDDLNTARHWNSPGTSNSILFKNDLSKKYQGIGPGSSRTCSIDFKKGINKKIQRI